MNMVSYYPVKTHGVVDKALDWKVLLNEESSGRYSYNPVDHVMVNRIGTVYPC